MLFPVPTLLITDWMVFLGTLPVHLETDPTDRTRSIFPPWFVPVRSPATSVRTDPPVWRHPTHTTLQTDERLQLEPLVPAT